MAKRKRQPTWLEVGIATAGMRTAVKAISWAYEWAVARETLGHEPTVEDVAEMWGLSRRTAFREQEAFRTAFPQLETPAAIYDTDEAREMIARHAALGEKLDQWKAERAARREVEAIRAVMLPATRLP